MSAIWAIAVVVIKELYRRKDFYVLFILTALITLLMASVQFFGDHQMARYVKEVCLLLIWVSALVIAVTTIARQLPAEREQRTIFPLLAKPVSRGEVVLGKFLGCWLACGLCLVVFYAFFGMVSAAREHTLPLASYSQALVLHWCMLGVVIALGLCGSIVFAAPSSNATICLVVCVGILLVGRHLKKVALTLQEPAQSLLCGLYYGLPHLELFDVRERVIHNLPVIGWGYWLVAVLYAAAYTGVFLMLAWRLFQRKALY